MRSDSWLGVGSESLVSCSVVERDKVGNNLKNEPDKSVQFIHCVSFAEVEEKREREREREKEMGVSGVNQVLNWTCLLGF